MPSVEKRQSFYWLKREMAICLNVSLNNLVCIQIRNCLKSIFYQINDEMSLNIAYFYEFYYVYAIIY